MLTKNDTIGPKKTGEKSNSAKSDSSSLVKSRAPKSSPTAAATPVPSLDRHMNDELPKRGLVARSFVFLLRFSLQILIMLAVLFGSYTAMNRMIASAPETPKRPPFRSVYTVDTVKVERKDYQPQFLVYGETVASRKVELRALVSGEITSVNSKLQVGATIPAGEPLLEIDRFNYEGALAEAEANLAEVQARISEAETRIVSEQKRLESGREQLALAQADLDRIVNLKRRGTANQKQVDDRTLIVSQRAQAVDQSEITLVAEQARLQQQKAALGRLEWKVRQAERNLKDTVLLSPFNGIVTQTQAEVGRLVSANDVVVAMYEADKLDARFTLTDQRFGRLQSDGEAVIGRDVTVRWVVGGKTFEFPAVIDRIGPEIASNRGGVEVFARITGNLDDVAIRPGAFIEILVPDRQFKDHIAIPETAIYDNNQVYLAVDGKLVARTVEVAGFMDEQVLVASGLEEGDEVLVTRIAEISEGLNVQTEADAAKTPPGPAGGEQANAETRQQVAFRDLAADEQQAIVTAILVKNNLTREAWDAMPRAERGPLIRAQMLERAKAAK